MIINGLFSSLTRQKCVVKINWRVIKVVLKISQMPSKLLFSANCSIFGQSWTSLGYYPPIYKPPEGFINWLSTHPTFVSSDRLLIPVSHARHMLRVSSLSTTSPSSKGGWHLISLVHTLLDSGANVWHYRKQPLSSNGSWHLISLLSVPLSHCA